MSRHKFEKKIVKYRVQKPEVEKAEAEKPLPVREGRARKDGGAFRFASLPRDQECFVWPGNSVIKFSSAPA